MNRRRPPSGLARAVINGVLLILSLLVATAVAEGLLRLANYTYAPLSITRSESSDERYHHAFEDADFVFDRELIWVPKKSHGVFNSQGYRGSEVALEKVPGEFRIVAVGDSNTLGWSGTEGANWPAELELLGRERGLDVTVVNAGVWGYSSYQGLGRLRQYLSLKPDLVLVSFGGNDGHPVTFPDRDYVARQVAENVWTRQLIGWRVGQLLLAVYDRTSAISRGADTSRRVDPVQYRATLHAMIRIARQNAARIALLTRPYVGEAHPRSWKSAAPDYNAVTAEVATDEQVPLIDLYTAFRDQRNVFADESHFTLEGHRLAAKVILRQLMPLLH